MVGVNCEGLRRVLHCLLSDSAKIAGANWKGQIFVTSEKEFESNLKEIVLDTIHKDRL